MGGMAGVEIEYQVEAGVHSLNLQACGTVS